MLSKRGKYFGCYFDDIFITTTDYRPLRRRVRPGWGSARTSRSRPPLSCCTSRGTLGTDLRLKRQNIVEIHLQPYFEKTSIKFVKTNPGFSTTCHKLLWHQSDQTHVSEGGWVVGRGLEARHSGLLPLTMNYICFTESEMTKIHKFLFVYIGKCVSRRRKFHLFFNKPRFIGSIFRLWPVGY